MKALCYKYITLFFPQRQKMLSREKAGLLKGSVGEQIKIIFCSVSPLKNILFSTERTKWGSLDILYFLYLIEKRKLCIQKHDRGSTFFETSKSLLSRWVGGWVVIKMVLQFCSKYGMETSKICLFQIRRQNLSTAIRSKGMNKLSLNF